MRLKIVVRILSISLALIISGMFIPSMACASLGTETSLTFEKAVLDAPTDTTLVLANKNLNDAITLYLLPSGDNGTCSIGVDLAEVTIPPNESVDLVVTYQTSTTEPCSGEILVYWFGGGSSGWHTIAIDGKAEEANVNRTIVIGALDTGILDREWQDRPISEWIDECAEGVRNHRDFVKSVFRLTKEMKKDGVITWEEKRVIRRYARKANIPSIAIEVSKRGTIVIGGRDTGIEDQTHDGYFISEWLKECSGDADTHGRFVSCVSQLMKKIKKEGLITKKDKRLIRRYVAKAKLYGRQCVK